MGAVVAVDAASWPVAIAILEPRAEGAGVGVGVAAVVVVVVAVGPLTVRPVPRQLLMAESQGAAVVPSRATSAELRRRQMPNRSPARTCSTHLGAGTQ